MPEDESFAWRPQPDPLLAGAIDMHVHGFPDIGMAHEARTDDLTMISLARAYGLRGLVLKSHFWPTMDRAFQLAERLAAPDFTVFGSITLNPLVGGILPMSVEAAAAHGAKVVFLPTWGARNDHERRGIVRKAVIDPCFPSIPAYLETGSLTVLDVDGALTPAMREIVALCKRHAMVLSTGHVSVAESVAIAEYAREQRFEKLLFAHPFSGSIGATMEDALKMAELGAFIEFTFAGSISVNHAVPSRSVLDAVRTIGPERCIITTDAFFEYIPPQPEALRTFTHQLRFIGCSDADLRRMIVGNPSQLLDVTTA